MGNIIVVKYEKIYLHNYETVRQVIEGIEEYFQFYNMERLHQSLNYRTPCEIYSISPMIAI